MRGGFLTFWIGAAAAYLVFALTASSSTIDVDIAPGDANGIVVAERVDQGPLSRALNPGIATLGTLRLTKRGWGPVTTYAQEIGVTAARLAQQAGTQLSVKVKLAIPGTVVDTNASGREAGALVWNELPRDARLRARTRAVNWPVVFLVLAAIAATAWRSRGHPGRASKSLTHMDLVARPTGRRRRP